MIKNKTSTTKFKFEGIYFHFLIVLGDKNSTRCELRGHL